MRYIACLVLFIHATVLRAEMFIGPWIPIYKGVDHITATNCPPTTVVNNGVSITDSSLQVVHCVRVDLTDPDVQLFTTPRAPSWTAETRETLSLSISNFVRNYKVQIASDANFYCVYSGSFCTPDPTSEGLASEVHGTLVCTGQVVSVADNQNRYASILFTTNKEPTINLNNRPPGADLTGIYTAVTGFYPVLTNGVNVWALYFSDFSSQYPDSSIHGFQPRTVFGLSQDKRYLFLMTIDGRQPNQSGGGSCGIGQYSNGALDAESALWLLQFGAWDAISMDGGGSTALYMADCSGEPVALNHSSLLAARNAERIIGCHFGVYAKPLVANFGNLTITPADTTATIIWQTSVPADTQLDYGPTSSYGNSWSNSALTLNHVVTLNGLNPSSSYYYRIRSFANGNTSTYACRLTTISSSAANRTTIFPITQGWRWTTNNLDGTNWMAPDYVDSSWSGPGAGLLYVENNINVTPKNTPLPPNNGIPMAGVPAAPTYYFRTHFTFSGDPASVTLYFTNYIDDGAVFYLNGTEIRRIRMTAAPAVISYTSLTDPAGSGPPCSGQGNANDAACPDIFALAGDLLTNLVSGDNVLAVEVHQAATTSNDIVFGSILSYSQTVVFQPTLNYFREGNGMTFYWNGSGFTLQQSDAPSGSWSNTAFITSPVSFDSLPDLQFFQLHK